MSSGNDTSASTTGQAVYRDSRTSHDGTSQQPAKPDSQSMSVFVTVKGTGTLPQVDARCATDPAGAFEAHYSGNSTVSNDGVYTAQLASAAGSIVTPSGCTIPDLTVSLITDVVVRGEFAATTQTCTSYCSASARADAEAMCGTSSSAASCRTNAESTAQAQCTTKCTQQASKITAEISLGANAIGHADASMLKAAAFGELSADLRFEHMEDSSGHVLDPH